MLGGEAAFYLALAAKNRVSDYWRLDGNAIDRDYESSSDIFLGRCAKTLTTFVCETKGDDRRSRILRNVRLGVRNHVARHDGTRITQMYSLVGS